MAEADDAEGWELVSLRAVGVTEFLDMDDEPAIRDTPAGTKPDWWIIRKTYKNGRERGSAGIRVKNSQATVRDRSVAGWVIDGCRRLHSRVRKECSEVHAAGIDERVQNFV
ncbi:hypothetical protein DGN16_23485 (plasmid) [Xanthomonas citri pv. fuscans]|nr:hypothetical protein DGN16_23485 [Xanthomonas citri pv. fuscans]